MLTEKSTTTTSDRQPLTAVLARAYDDESAARGQEQRWDDLNWRQRQFIRVMWQTIIAGQRDPDTIAAASWARHRTWIAARADAHEHLDPDSEAVQLAQHRALAVRLLSDADATSADQDRGGQ